MIHKGNGEIPGANALKSHHSVGPQLPKVKAFAFHVHIDWGFPEDVVGTVQSSPSHGMGNSS